MGRIAGREGQSGERQADDFPPDPQWYKDAVIYELHVRAFRDSTGSGIGDFRGLTSKLDYLADLGVTALWLLPFYPSPGRADGYDIADYGQVNPDYGTMRDVRNLIREGKTFQIPSMIQTGKKFGMQSLDDAIMAFLNKKMISAEDAYAKSVDKSKFVGFLKNPPTDFTEA